jgi:hypothetical protein
MFFYSIPSKGSVHDVEGFLATEKGTWHKITD